jgi:hypothetical protein
LYRFQRYRISEIGNQRIASWQPAGERYGKQ